MSVMRDDRVLKRALRARKIRVKNFPCVDIAYRSTMPCKEHPAPVPCPDRLVIPWKNGWAIPVYDGGSSFIPIDYCPWCGISLK